MISPTGIPGSHRLIPAELEERYAAFRSTLAQQLDHQILAAVPPTVAAGISLPNGKHRRATLVFVAGHLGDPDHQQLCDAALIVELLQTASLVHDDVIDRATQRRGVSSVHRQVGEPLALLIGAGMFAAAAEVAANLGHPAAQDLSYSAVQLSRGELLDVERAFDLDISPDDHLKLLETKTGALFALPAVLGGRCGHQPVARLHALAALGRALGIAYQLADDWADISGTDPGKPKGTDWRNGLYSLAVLHAVNDGGDRVLREHLSATDRDRLDPGFVYDRVVRTGGADRVHVAIDSALSDARSSLSQLPPGPAHRGLSRFIAALADEVLK